MEYEGVILEKMSEIFSTFHDTKSDGKTSTLIQSSKWMNHS